MFEDSGIKGRSKPGTLNWLAGLHSRPISVISNMSRTHFGTNNLGYYPRNYHRTKFIGLQ
jgi:hypothetical protein